MMAPPPLYGEASNAWIEIGTLCLVVWLWHCKGSAYAAVMRGIRTWPTARD